MTPNNMPKRETKKFTTRTVRTIGQPVIDKNTAKALKESLR